MLAIANYTLVDKIHDGAETTLFRGHQNEDGRPVMIKVPKWRNPPPRVLAELRHEYGILRGLDLEGVIKAYALEKCENGLALVLSALPGEPLIEVMRDRPLDLTTALCVAIAIARTLGGLHRQRVIHRDIKPHNILFDQATGEVHLIDFGIATRISQSTPKIVSPEALEGTLAYMSPEQTGRMNRVVDYRTDFYSLGVTVYQMLTGVLPFQGNDPMEIVHSHVARTPEASRALCPAIPEAVSNITMKLLAKAAEDRYQSAHGLIADLEECQRQLRVSFDVSTFPLGRHDKTGTLRIPQKLYGRAPEIQELLSAVDRVKDGACELLLISGSAGIGKSSLVNEVHKAIAAHRGGYFISGKFDQLNRGVPYAPLARAFRGLIEQILTESEERLSAFRSTLQDALGGNGQVLVELLPELALIIGAQPDVPALGPSASQNRFQMVFKRFLRVFTTREHPLVLFLDDLQWADPASLKLLSVLLTDPERGHMLVIGAYRSNEVDLAHPLALALAELRKAGASASEITLRPLALPEVTELLCDALSCEPSRSSPLAAAVLAKTQGNAFFVNQLLGALNAEGLLRFDPEAGAWAWDQKAIDGHPATDNVVDFMAGKIRLLPPATQRILMLAASIGHEFDLGLLSVIHETSPESAVAVLWGALEEGLVLPVDGSDPSREGQAGDDARRRYRFLHDRVQQAAYSLIEESEKAETHLRIGRLILTGTAEDEREEVLFALVNHLNVGAPKMDDPHEKTTLAELNLSAGAKAKAANAHEAAARYFQAGAEILGERGWQDLYPLCFRLHHEQAECEALSGRFEQADGLFQRLLGRARTLVERASIYTLMLKRYHLAGSYAEGLELGVKGLALFGITLPETEEALQAAILAEKDELARRIGDRSIASLLSLPRMTDPERRAAMEMLSALVPATYIGSPSLFPLIALKMATFSLLHGHAEESCFGYSAYAFMLVSLFGDIRAGFELSELSLKLNEQLGDLKLRGALLHLHGDHINFWCRHIRTDFPFLERAFSACLEVGDLIFSGYIAFEIVWQAIERGDTTHEVLELLQRYAAFARQTGNDSVYQTILLQKQLMLALQGLTRGDTRLSDDTFEEEECLSQLTKVRFGCGVAFYHIIKLILLYLHGRTGEALAAAAAARDTLGAVMAMPIEATYHFFWALCLAARHDEASPEERRAGLSSLEACLSKLEFWARHCPENFEHRYLLVRAEESRIEGRHLDAMALYDQAIESALKNEFPHYASLANELSGRHYLALGRARAGLPYMTAAYHGYLQWGADAKARRLAEAHPAVLGDRTAFAFPARSMALSETTTSSRFAAGASSASAAKIARMVEAAQSFASEMVLDKVFGSLTRVAAHKTGARRSFLILEQQGALRVEAMSSIDPDVVKVGMGIPLNDCRDLPVTVVKYVARTTAPLVLPCAQRDPRFLSDPFIASRPLTSILCVAMMQRGQLSGVLYLDNDLAEDAFNRDRIELLEILSAQAATAVENALLYGHVREMNLQLQQTNEALERQVLERTEELRRNNDRLRHELGERERAEEARVRAEQARAALQKEVIGMQAALLLELSAPLIPITDAIVVLPLIGAIDDQRAQQVLETTLRGAQERRAKVVIIDITGMKKIDKSAAAALIKTASALRLLGAQTVLAGVQPEAAQTLSGLDVDLRGVVTHGSLQRSISFALRRTGELVR